MNRTHKICLAAALALGLTGSVASASDVQVVILDAHARVNKEYRFMMGQPEI